MTQQQDNGHNEVSSDTSLEFAPLRSSDQIVELATALAKAQGVMRHPGKNKVAKVPTKTGGSYSYNYADLADVLDAVRGPFAANGLSVVQVPFNRSADVVGICTRIMHSSGQWIEGTLYMPCADSKPQTIGSAITYGRRYAISPMAGIASDDDDDGNAAQGHDSTTERRPGRGTTTAPKETVYEPVEGQVSRPQSTLPPKHARVLAAFTELGVTIEQLEGHVGGTAFAALKEADLDDLRTLYAEVKDGTIKASAVGRKDKATTKEDTKAKLTEKFKK